MKKTSSGGCSSSLFLLFFVFLILKVSGAVAWSWWWVTCPLWLPVAFVLIALVLMAVMGVGIYKTVSVVFGRQGPRRTARPKSETADGEVLDVEGTEVRASPPASSGKRGLEGLPAADADSTQGD